MPSKKSNSDEAISTIRDIRSHNNNLWMGLLHIALNSEPKKTRAVMKKIAKNDAEVTKWLKKL